MTDLMIENLEPLGIIQVISMTAMIFLKMVVLESPFPIIITVIIFQLISEVLTQHFIIKEWVAKLLEFLINISINTYIIN